MVNLVKKFAAHCKEIWDYRVVMMAMVRRNTAGRYKSTFIGFGWHLLMPVLTIMVLNVVFGTIRPKPIEDFWIYLSAGMCPVTFRSGCLRGTAIKSNANYLKKMYFPKEIIIFADVIAQMLTLIFAYLVIIIVILSAGQPVNWLGMGFLVVELFLMFIFGIGCSMIMSTISVFIKDVGYLASVFMRLVVWITPTFFMVSEAKGILATIVWFNPFTYFVEVFHDILYYSVFPATSNIVMSVILAFAVLAVGWIIFARYKDRFAEVL